MTKRARKIRKKEILHLIYFKEEVSKPELAEEFNVSLPTISAYINQLEQSGWLISTEKGVSSGGRKPLLYSLNPEYRYIIGINLRYNHFYIFIANLKGEVVVNKLVTVDNLRFENYVELICAATEELIVKLMIGKQDILGVGICISGVTDFSHKIVDRSKELDWNYMPLGHVLEHRLGLPVFVENDSRVHARNEIDHSDPHHVGVVIYLADSVGLALVMENEVFRGYSNRAGDNRFFGPSRDSLQELIRTNDILYELTSQPYYSSLDRKIIQDLNQRVAEHLLAKPENEVVIEEFIKQLTKLVLVMINIFNPKRILLTGNVFDYTDVVYRGVKQRILMSDKIYLTPVVRRTASLDNPLETALVQFTLEKFFSKDYFRI